ncbi:MAG: YeiH family protein, partial [Bacteroidia bacterium]|nr:YeiH family protein [Bacteroidia bacterium]
NVLIGLIAFGVAIYFSTRVDRSMDSKVGWGEIWKRFPKFVLGFIGASLLFSITYSILDPNTAHAFIDQGVINAFTKNIRGWLFCLAFVSIGLSINFKDLKKHFIGGKPLLLYLCGQTFNLSLTLLMAYIMFYLVFPDITNNI